MTPDRLAAAAAQGHEDAVQAWPQEDAQERAGTAEVAESICVHCGDRLGDSLGNGLFVHAHGLQRCQGDAPYGHMGHPAMPCPPDDINPCLGYREDECTHLAASAQDEHDDALRELSRAATPGPWSFTNSSDYRGRKGEFRAPSPHNGFMLAGPWTNDADAALMVAAVNHLRAEFEHQADALAAASLLRQDPPQVAGEDVERVAREEAERRWTAGEHGPVSGWVGGFVQGYLAALSARPVQAQEVAAWQARAEQVIDRLQEDVERWRNTAEQAQRGRREALSAHADCPTRWAYEQACKALDKHRERANSVEVERDAALACAEAAEGVVESLRNLADEWERRAGQGSESARVFGHQKVSVEFVVAEVRRLLPDRALLDTDSEGREAGQPVAQEGEAVVPLATERAIRAESWDEGFEAGWSAQDPDDHAPNPYRVPVETGGEER